MTTTDVRLVKVEARSYDHDASDRRRPTRYAVYLGDEKIGEVASRSTQSWRTDGRIRYSMRGFTRHWEGYLAAWPGHRAAVRGYTRADAVDSLVREHQAGKNLS